ncbi:hypothetical protein ACKWTF_012448 [Chironomus riparius]
MKKLKCLYFIILVIFSVSNGETFADDGTMDYDDEGATIITFENTTTEINTLMSTTSANSELSTSTIKNLEENSHEMNVSQTLSIFSLKNIESKFNDLIVKLDHEQVIYLNDTKNSSKIHEKEYKSIIKSQIQMITTVFEEFDEHFNEYEKIKNEMEEKMQLIRENYIREIFAIEIKWINDQIAFYKEYDKVVNKKQMYATLQKLYTAENSTEKLIKVNNDFDEVERKLQNDSIYLEENHQNYLNLTDQAELKMTNDLSELLNDTKYDEVSKKFEDLLKMKKKIENLLKFCTDYSAYSNILLSEFTKNLIDLNSQLVMSKIMPSDNEIVQFASKHSYVPLTKISRSSDMTNYKWVQAYQGNTRLSENSVVGGQDVDGVPFYVARIKDYKSYLYGKFAFSLGRRHAYFPYEYVEYGVEKFEVIFFKYFQVKLKLKIFVI